MANPDDPQSSSTPRRKKKGSTKAGRVTAPWPRKRSDVTVKARIARTILRLAEYLGEEPDGEHIAIRHRFSQNDIAAMAAIARESVNRTMHEWREKGIVSVPTRSTMVVHKARLQRELGTPARKAEMAEAAVAADRAIGAD